MSTTNTTNTMNVVLKCPACGNTEGIVTELKCFGWSNCPRCRYRADTTEFKIKKLETKVMNKYLTADGHVITILSHDKIDNTFTASNSEEYNHKGHDIRDNHYNDLIAEIPDSLHFEILKLIKEYYEGYNEK